MKLFIKKFCLSTLCACSLGLVLSLTSFESVAADLWQVALTNNSDFTIVVRRANTYGAGGGENCGTIDNQDLTVQPHNSAIIKIRTWGDAIGECGYSYSDVSPTLQRVKSATDHTVIEQTVFSFKKAPGASPNTIQFLSGEPDCYTADGYSGITVKESCGKTKTDKK